MTGTRKPLSKKTRFEVFKRDGFKCMYCGAHPPTAVLEVDHVIPVAHRGDDSMDNLISACFDCNRGKAANSLDLVPQSLASKAAETKEREEQLKGFHDVMEAKRARLDGQAWEVMEVFYPGNESVRRDEFNGARKFIEKLGFHEVLEAAEIALGAPISYRNNFRYFCGICWNKLRLAGEAL